MDDPTLMCRIQSSCNLARNIKRLFQRQGSVPEALFNRGPFNDFHHQIVGADVVESADVCVVQSRDGPCFTLKTVGEAFTADLQGYITVEPRVPRTVNLAHSAHPEQPENLVWTENRSVSEWHHLARSFSEN